MRLTTVIECLHFRTCLKHSSWTRVDVGQIRAAINTWLKLNCSFFTLLFLPRNALLCKTRSCDRMSSVCPSVRLSVRPSVTLVDSDHIGLKSWKLIARTISTPPSLFVAKRRSIYSQGNMGEFGGDWRCGRKKVACWRTKVAISLKRVKIEKTLLWTAYRNSPTLFWTVPPSTTYGLPFPKIKGSQPPLKTAI